MRFVLTLQTGRGHVHLARQQLQHFLSCRRITFAFSFCAPQNNRDARERRDVRICHGADVLTRVRNRILLPAHADFNCGGKRESGGERSCQAGACHSSFPATQRCDSAGVAHFFFLFFFSFFQPFNFLRSDLTRCLFCFSLSPHQSEYDNVSWELQR